MNNSLTGFAILCIISDVIIRRRHKLPKFPEQVESVFNQFCENLPPAAIADVRSELNKAVEKLIRDAAHNEKIDIALVNSLHRASEALLDRYEDFKDSERAMIIGAIRYFVIEEDPLPDSGFASGYYDDARVMNYVLDQLGEHEFLIDL